MTRSACLIFNPVSGQGNPETELSIIREILEPEIQLDIRETTPELDANQLAHEAVERGAQIIIASGGDGTVSAAAEAVINTNIPFGIIPRGTANAFSVALGLPNSIQQTTQIILEGNTRLVDAATCNGKPMVLLTGIGLEAQAVELAERESKNWLGKLAYVIGGLATLRELQTFNAEIEVENIVGADSTTVNIAAIAITVANAAPATSILAQGPAGVVADDGLLDVTILTAQTQLQAIGAMTQMFGTALRGTATEHEQVHYLRTRRIKIIADPPQKVVIDGELSATTPVEVECIPKGLQVFVKSEEQ